MVGVSEEELNKLQDDADRREKQLKQQVRQGEGRPSGLLYMLEWRQPPPPPPAFVFELRVSRLRNASKETHFDKTRHRRSSVEGRTKYGHRRGVKQLHRSGKQIKRAVFIHVFAASNPWLKPTLGGRNCG